MTPKQRILASIRGEATDRTPWSPFLAYYWSYLPKEVQQKGQLAYLQGLGADPLLRGEGTVSRNVWHHCQIRESVSDGVRRVIHETPVGTLETRYTYSSGGDTWFITRHPVETEEDFKVLQYLFEHLEVEEQIREFNRIHSRIGEQGLAVPVIGTNLKTSFQSLVETWCGTENLSYALADYPETVEECLSVIRQRDLENVKIAAESQAEAFIFWEDSSTTNISPATFEAYTLPVIREWGDVIHSSGKLLIHHACGHLRHFMPLIARSGIDALESISPPPTGNIEPEEIRAALPEKIALIGGIEPTRLLNTPMEELEAQVALLLEHMKGTRYVLGNSDSCPPYVEEEKFRMISRLVRRMAD